MLYVHRTLITIATKEYLLQFVYFLFKKKFMALSFYYININIIQIQSRSDL